MLTTDPAIRPIMQMKVSNKKAPGLSLALLCCWLKEVLGCLPCPTVSRKNPHSQGITLSTPPLPAVHSVSGVFATSMVSILGLYKSFPHLPF